MPAEPSAASAGLSQHDRLGLGSSQCIPGIEVGRDIADGIEEFPLGEIVAPPPGAVELDEMRSPTLGQRTPLAGDPARIPNFDFSRHDPPQRNAMKVTRFDELLRGRNERGPESPRRESRLSCRGVRCNRNCDRVVENFAQVCASAIDSAANQSHRAMNMWRDYSAIFSAFASSPMMPRRKRSTTTTKTTPWITVTH